MESYTLGSFDSELGLFVTEYSDNDIVFKFPKKIKWALVFFTILFSAYIILKNNNNEFDNNFCLSFCLRFLLDIGGLYIFLELFVYCYEKFFADRMIFAIFQKGFVCIRQRPNKTIKKQNVFYFSKISGILNRTVITREASGNRGQTKCYFKIKDLNNIVIFKMKHSPDIKYQTSHGKTNTVHYALEDVNRKWTNYLYDKLTMQINEKGAVRFDDNITIGINYIKYKDKIVLANDYFRCTTDSFGYLNLIPTDSASKEKPSIISLPVNNMYNGAVLINLIKTSLKIQYIQYLNHSL